MDSESPAHSRPVVVGTAERNGRPLGGSDLAGEGEEATQLVLVPILRDAAAAGPGRVVHEHDIEAWGAIYRGWCPNPEQTDYIRVHGSSMEPTIPDGALVTVDRSRNGPNDVVGKPALVYRADDDAVTIKRILLAEGGRLVAMADNPRSAELGFALDFGSGDRIVGLVRTVHAEVG